MGIPSRETLKKIPKVDRSQSVKLERAQRKIKTAAQGESTGPVIAEGLKGVGSAPKPAWWQGAVPSWLRVGGQPYKGAYPAPVSGERVFIQNKNKGFKKTLYYRKNYSLAQTSFFV